MASQALESVADSYKPKPLVGVFGESNESLARRIAGRANTVSGKAEIVEGIVRGMHPHFVNRDFENIVSDADAAIKHLTVIRDWAAERAPGGKFGEPSLEGTRRSAVGSKLRELNKWAGLVESEAQIHRWDGVEIAALNAAGYATDIAKYARAQVREGGE